MESLIIPVVLLVFLGVWGAFETGRKFRREFRLRGTSWAEACTALEGGRGMLVIDTIWGPQRGLGHPALWWIEESILPGADLSRHIETGGSARLVRCPGRLKDVETLRRRFGPERVLMHSWSLAEAAADTRK